MKSLKDYILEHREYFNPEISLERLKKIFKSVVFEMKIDDEDLEFIKSLYPSNDKSNISREAIYGILDAYCYSPKGMNGNYTDAGVKRFLDLLKKQPLSRIQRFLGAGSEGMVYDLGNGKVLKVFFDFQSFESDYKQTIKEYQQMIGHKYETLPNIYKVTDRYVIRDKVNRTKSDIDDIEKFYNTTQENIVVNDASRMNLEQIVMSYSEKHINKSSLTPDQKQALDWLVVCRDELRSIGCDYHWGLGDFYISNLGKTDDGRIVYFDW